jgi:hypothetical protein
MSRYLEIKLQRCLVCLTEKELLALLAREPGLWALSLRRGKGVTRGRKAAAREAARALPRDAVERR